MESIHAVSSVISAVASTSFRPLLPLLPAPPFLRLHVLMFVSTGRTVAAAVIGRAEGKRKPAERPVPGSKDTRSGERLRKFEVG